MKTTKYLTALIAAAVLGLTSCSSSSSPGSPETVEADEEIYLEVLAEKSYFDGVPDEDLVELGYLICDLLDQGDGFDSVLLSAVDSGVPPYEAGYMLGASVGGLCPEHSEDMEAFFDSGGEV